MTEVVSIRDSSSGQTTTKLTKRDWNILIKTLSRPLTRHVDIFEGILLLERKKIISETEYVRLLEKFEAMECSNGQMFKVFVMETLVMLSMEDLIILLKDLKMNDMARELITAKYGKTVEILVGKSLGVSDEILTYYSRTKCDMDNNIFLDRRVELETRAKCLLESFSEIVDPEEKCFAVHKYVIITFLRTTLYRDKPSRDRILNEMMANIPEDVDKTFAEIVYKGNMAKTAVFIGDEELAKKFIQEALVLGENCQEAFVKIFTYHDQQHVYRCLFSDNPTEENMRNVSVSGQIGQAVLQDLSDEKSMVWRKVFVSETAMSLLKIHKTFEVMYSEPISDTNRNLADQLLKTLDGQTSSEEKRREMLTYLCKARVVEEKCPKLAKTYAKKAKDYAVDGSHYPDDFLNISDYYSHLCERTVPKQIENSA